MVDVYPFSETVVASAELDRDGARAADQPDISLPARASGNQIVPTDDDSRRFVPDRCRTGKFHVSASWQSQHVQAHRRVAKTVVGRSS